MLREKLRRYMRENPRTWLLLYIPVYLLGFVAVESMVTEDYWISYMEADDRIPFIPEFVVFYVLWYPYLLGSIFYLYFRDHQAFVRYALFLIMTLSASLITFAVFPNGQELRPDDTGEGVCGWMLERIYAADTNTNVLPSMHAVTCAGTIIAAFDSPALRRARFPVTVLGILIAFSTVFVKQHSLLDVIWAGIYAAAAWLCIYVLPKICKKGTKMGEKES